MECEGRYINTLRTVPAPALRRLFYTKMPRKAACERQRHQTLFGLKVLATASPLPPLLIADSASQRDGQEVAPSFRRPCMKRGRKKF